MVFDLVSIYLFFCFSFFVFHMPLRSICLYVALCDTIKWLLNIYMFAFILHNDIFRLFHIDIGQYSVIMLLLICFCLKHISNLTFLSICICLYFINNNFSYFFNKTFIIRVLFSDIIHILYNMNNIINDHAAAFLILGLKASLLNLIHLGFFIDSKIILC